MGTTLRQYHRKRFFDLCDALAEAAKRLDTVEGKRAFVILSLQVHAAKANVPKSLWRFANVTLKEARSITEWTERE